MFIKFYFCTLNQVRLQKCFLNNIMVFNFLDEKIRFYVPSKVEDQTRPKTSDDNVRRYGPSLKKINEEFSYI